MTAISCSTIGASSRAPNRIWVGRHAPAPHGQEPAQQNPDLWDRLLDRGTRKWFVSASQLSSSGFPPSGVLQKCIFWQSASLMLIERPDLSSRALTRDPEISN